jgi:hypothetical protein
MFRGFYLKQLRFVDVNNRNELYLRSNDDKRSMLSAYRMLITSVNGYL